VRDKTWCYVRKAGGVLLPASIIIWGLTTFPLTESGGNAFPGTSGHKDAISGSFAGRIGRGLEPVLAPLGFDWKIAIASVTGFAAKEIVVSTLGVLYRVEGADVHKTDSLRAALQRDPVFRPLVAYVLMLFMLIVVPCFASLAVIYAEIGVRWLCFAVIFWMVLAWGLCFLVYQTGTLLGF
jgi:ferrous iron transport protein B